MNLCDSHQIDKEFGWKLGRSERLARKGKLPHYVLADDTIRFNHAEVLATIRRVPAQKSAPKGGAR